MGRSAQGRYDPQRDKSFLSSVVGIAVERGMIKSVDDAVRD